MYAAAAIMFCSSCNIRWHWISLIDFGHKIELIYLFCFVIIFGERIYPSDKFVDELSWWRTAAATAALHKHLSPFRLPRSPRSSRSPFQLSFPILLALCHLYPSFGSSLSVSARFSTTWLAPAALALSILQWCPWSLDASF